MNNQSKVIIETPILTFNPDKTYTVTKSRVYTSKEEAYKAMEIIEGRSIKSKLFIYNNVKLYKK
jgi:hypothetical protein